MNNDKVDELVAAGDPYPQRSVDDLALQAASQELMEEVMSTPTRAPIPKDPAVQRRPRWVAPVIAAAAVAAVVAGAVAVIGPQSDDHGQRAQNAGAPSAGADTAPPTSDNLRQVVVGQDGWQVDGLNDVGAGGSISWQDGSGKGTLEMSWYDASDYDAYLRDRKTDYDDKERVSLLGQQGWAFSERIDEASTKGELSCCMAPRPGKKIDPKRGRSHGEPETSLRVMTILPTVGDRFLEFDATVADRAEYDELMSTLQRVDRRTWLGSLDGAVVQPAEAEAFLEEASRDVPMPAGVTVTPEDLNLPQDPYQARAAFVRPVLCGWAEEYVGGDDAALDVLRKAEDWPVLQAMTADGDYAESVPEEVRILERHPQYQGWRQMFGC